MSVLQASRSEPPRQVRRQDLSRVGSSRAIDVVGQMGQRDDDFPPIKSIGIYRSRLRDQRGSCWYTLWRCY